MDQLDLESENATLAAENSRLKNLAYELRNKLSEAHERIEALDARALQMKSFFPKNAHRCGSGWATNCRENSREIWFAPMSYTYVFKLGSMVARRSSISNM